MFVQVTCVKQVEARNTEDYCECILADVVDFLQRHFLSMKKLIETQEEVVASRVRTSLQTLQVKMEELRKRSVELECLAQTDNHIRFLQVFTSLETSSQSVYGGLYHFLCLFFPSTGMAVSAAPL